MNTLHIFLALCWALLTVATLIGGLWLAYQHALHTDQTDVPTHKAVAGVILRVILTLAFVAVIIGLPLDLTHF